MPSIACAGVTLVPIAANAATEIRLIRVRIMLSRLLAANVLPDEVVVGGREEMSFPTSCSSAASAGRPAGKIQRPSSIDQSPHAGAGGGRMPACGLNLIASNTLRATFFSAEATGAHPPVRHRHS